MSRVVDNLTPPSTSPARARTIAALRRAVVEVDRAHPVRVAVDGVGAAGKTMLADELADAVRSSGRPVIRAGMDGFHNPRRVRHARGPESPRGYYLDSFNYGALSRHLLDPLGPGGSRRYRAAVYDFRSDSPVESPELLAAPDAILIFDGIFLQKEEVRSKWDFTVFVDAGFDVTVARAVTRDVELFGSPEAVRARYAKRYVPGERLYLRIDSPRDRADVVVVNDDPEEPTLEWPQGGPEPEWLHEGSAL